ncbi:hypothetical protein F4778DRAFT_760267 [Xylariomycetidae sp. FL2044]|nr:hypothetical protein F4778DRAFT_760267 [Xylariomycetidae sp. FL2044]
MAEWLTPDPWTLQSLHSRRVLWITTTTKRAITHAHSYADQINPIQSCWLPKDKYYYYYYLGTILDIFIPRMIETSRYAPGGFIPSATLPSPAPSTASTRAAARLPHPRSRPLAPGSRKEDYARDFVSRRLMHISRRYVKKHGIPDPADEVTGYESMDEVCRDLEQVIDVLWFSGTPSLQIPYLLNIALAFNSYLPSFEPSPRPTFALLQKLDHCFASLLVGTDVKTNEPLPGFQKRGLEAGLSRTDMVRCKSLADQTRMLVAVIMSGEADVEDYAEDEEQQTNTARPDSKAKSGQDSKSDSDITPLGANLNVLDDDLAIKQEEANSWDDISSDEEETEERDVAQSSSKKRRTSEAGLEDKADDGPYSKRIKVEPPTNAESLAAIPTSPLPPSTREPDTAQQSTSNNGKFQWAIDPDSESDSDLDTDVSPKINAMPSPSNIVAKGGPHPAGIDENDVKPDLEDKEEDDDEEEERAEELDEAEEEEGGEEEEEELHMNIAKVYEKTLTQLGNTLGESIVDD